MKWIALVARVLTAGFGFVMLTIFINRGGLRQGGNGPQIRPPLIFSHFGLAAIGFILWLVYLITDNATKWIAFVLLLAVAVLGWTMFAIQQWRRRAGVSAGTRPAAGDTAEQHFPIPVITLHGLLAVATVVLDLPSEWAVRRVKPKRVSPTR